MRRPRTGLARLLACLLLLQWAGAMLPHARAMAAASSALAVELCSPGGKRIVLLDENGQPVQRDHATDCCALCQGPAAAPAPQPMAVASPAGYVLVTAPQGRAGLPSTPPRAPPQQPRAPPLP
jgi:hypothetical protein